MDYTALLTQFNVFEGSQQMGATRSFINKFCNNLGNTFLCVDLLTLYMITALLRDKVFFQLAFIIKDSSHNDADSISTQILTASEYK